MKGFKPTGYGPSAGFKFPQRMGFTGSTGAYTSVSPYVRRKGFANGGFVREDNPRMKEESIGDQGHATVKRGRAYAKWQDDVGAHSSLLPGYKRGGKAKRKGKGPLAAMKKADGGAVSEAEKSDDRAAKYMHSYVVGHGEHANRMLSTALAAEARSRGLREKNPKGHGPLAPRMKKADGGYVDRRYRVPRRYTDYSVAEGVRAVAPLAREMAGALSRRARGALGGYERKVGGTQSTIDEYTANASRYSRGGKMRRMGYADGGETKQSNFDDWNDYYQRNLSGGRYKTRRKLTTPPPQLPPKEPAAGSKSKFYAKGGAVSATEAKKIAERTVGEHVRYPAPKGHKGLEKVMPK